MFLCSLVVFCIHAEFRKLCELFAAELKRFCISVSVLKRPNGDIEGDVAVPQTGSWWTGGGAGLVRSHRECGGVLGPRRVPEMVRNSGL